MSKLRLRSASFIVRYKENLLTVRGHTLSYDGHELGIYRKEHVPKSNRRKYDWALVDLKTGLAIAYRGRKSLIVEELESDKAEYWPRFLEITQKDVYKKHIEELKNMKLGGSRNA